MKRKFVIALSDKHGHLHMIATDVESEEDLKNLNRKIYSWNPEPTPNPPYGSYFSREDIFNSLKELTNHDFYVYKPDRHISYGRTGIDLPCI